MGATKAKPDSSGIVTGGSLMHMAQREPDFSGWATKAGIKCSDGRTIMPDAFKHQDGVRVPLVWQHQHDTPENILGHAVLHHREEGVYADAYFNDTPQARTAKQLVQHDDINALSIFANRLVEKASAVMHGMIREVSLVMAGANPGALIDQVLLQHGDGTTEQLEDEAVIYTGLTLKHAKSDSEDDKDKTAQDVYDDMTPEQQDVVHYMIGAALDAAESSDDDSEAAHSGIVPGNNTRIRKVIRTMSHNVFEQRRDGKAPDGPTLSHDDLKSISARAKVVGSYKQAVEEHALAHGIENIGLLFPDAKSVTDTPEFDKRRTEWVAGVINGVRKVPFARIKSLVADLRQDAARAKGYIKGNFKKEEWFGLTKRTTTPTTFYKKQQLDRDDIIDITEMDVVVWLKGEMRLMLDEEFARAVLIGDGREIDDEDKIKDPAAATDGAGIRSILHDHDLYAASINIQYTDRDFPTKIIDEIISSMRFYKGSGSPTFFTTLPWITTMLLAKDTTGRRLYNTKEELANVLGVSSLVAVEPMEDERNLVGIIVNLSDYSVGTDRGGEITMFDDFDIDYNQYRYLIEGRSSGALTKIRSALIIRTVDASLTEAFPEEPDFDSSTNTITVATTTGVVYRRTDTNAVVRTDTPIVLTEGQTLKIWATPATGYFFENNVDDEWIFTYQS